MIETSGSGLANLMSTATLTPLGDNGAVFVLSRPVLLDFQGRVGVQAVDGTQAAATFFVNGANSTIRNFSNVVSARTAFVVGSAGAGSTIANGSCSDEGRGILQRCVWLATNAHGVGLRDLRIGSPLLSGGSAIRLAASSTVNDLSIERVQFTNPNGTPYNAFASQGTTTLNRFRLFNSRFEGFTQGSQVLNFAGITISTGLIAQNQFLNNDLNNRNAGIIQIGRGGTNIRVVSNNFLNPVGSNTGSAVRSSGMGLAGSTVSGWDFSENNFDGFTGPATIFLGPGSGRIFMLRNSFGPNNPDGADAAAETGQNVLLFNDVNSNMQIRSWFPSDVTRTGSCEVSVTLNPPTSGNVPQVPVEINAFYTAEAQAEQHIARFTDLSARATVAIQFTGEDGFLRLQTFGRNGGSSQFSRVAAIPAGGEECRPVTEVRRSPVQDESTSERELEFRVDFSEPILEDLTTSGVTLSGSTAEGARVTRIDRLTATSFAVWVRVDGTGTVVLGALDAAVQDASGQPSLPAEGTDASTVQYSSPLKWTEEEVSVSKGDTVGLGIESAAMPAAPVEITTRVDNASLVTSSPNPAVMRTFEDRVAVELSGTDDRTYTGNRETSVAGVARSDDPNFDGMVLDPVRVELVDVNRPSPEESLIEVSDGSRVANGIEQHVATVRVRNAAGGEVRGSTVLFSGPAELQFDQQSCVSDAAGNCEVLVSSVDLGSFEVGAQLVTGDVPRGSPATVEFVAGAADPVTSEIRADDASLTADGVAETGVTVTLRDATGHKLGRGDDEVTMEASAGTLTDVVDEGDGSYTAMLTVPTTAGRSVVSFTVNGEDALETAVVSLEAGVPSLDRSTIQVNPDEVVADGQQTADVTVVLYDGYGNRVDRGGYDVAIGASSGAISDETDLGDGSFSAIFTAPEVAGQSLSRFTIGGEQAAAYARVVAIPGPADAARSEISANPDVVIANGYSESAIFVRLRDAFGNALAAGGDDVEIRAEKGLLTATTDLGSGLYEAVLRAPSEPGVSPVTFVVNDEQSPNSRDVEFRVGPPSVLTSEFSVTPTTVIANGVSTAELTLVARDLTGNRVPQGDDDVSFSSNVGSIGDTTDYGDGRYSTVLTSQVVAATGAVRFEIEGDQGPAVPVRMVPGAADAAASTLSVTPRYAPASGEDWVRVQLTLRDANGNLVLGTAESTDEVRLVTDLGELGSYDPATQRAYVKSTRAGTATVSLFVNGQESPSTGVVRFYAGSADPEQSQISAQPTRLVADGNAESEVTVVLRDRKGNLVKGTDVELELVTDVGELSDPVSNGEGEWTAVLTSTVARTATVGFTLYGLASPNEVDVEFVPGAADTTRSSITAQPAVVVADGEAASNVRIDVVDAFGNAVTTDVEVEATTSLGELGDLQDSGDGVWIGQLRSTIAGEALVRFSLNGALAVAEATVVMTPGPLDRVQSSLTASPQTIVADGVDSSILTVELNDANLNPISVDHVVELESTIGEISAVTRTGPGTYQASLTGVRAGTATIRCIVDETAISATQIVRLVPGEADPATSILTAEPSRIVADGIDTAEVTLQLRDTFGNPTESSPLPIELDTTAGDLGDLMDNRDGSYTAQLTATTVGQAERSAASRGLIVRSLTLCPAPLMSQPRPLRRFREASSRTEVTRRCCLSPCEMRSITWLIR
jgi:adhesin/invasin